MVALKLLLNGWKMLTAKDYANAIALINRATVQGTEVEEIAQLKAKLMQAHNQVKRLEDSPQLAAVPEGEQGQQ